MDEQCSKWKDYTLWGNRIVPHDVQIATFDGNPLVATWSLDDGVLGI